MKIIHFSDLHVWTLKGWDGDLSIKRLLGRANLLLRRKNAFPPELGQKVIKAILEREADLVIFSGDASTASMMSEFEVSHALFQPIYDKWGDRFLVVPGNHDRYTRHAASNRLFERHFPFAPSEYPHAWYVNEQLTVLGLDLSVARSITARGDFPRQKLPLLQLKLAEIKKNGKQVIVVGHYPLAYPPEVRIDWQHVLPQREEILKALQEAGVAAYLHGHKHRRWVVRKEGLAKDASPIYCINSGSAGLKSADPMRSAGFLEIEMGEGGLPEVEAFVIVSPEMEIRQFLMPSYELPVR